MVSKNTLIGIGILVIVGLGLMFVSNITGNVVTGSVATEKVNDDEYFKISEFGEDDPEVSINTEVENGA